MSEIKWDIESEYPSIDSKEFSNDLNDFLKSLEILKKTSLELSPQMTEALKDSNVNQQLVEKIQNFLIENEKATILHLNIRSYLNCRLSIDTAEAISLAKLSEMNILKGQLLESVAGVDLFIKKCSEAYISAILNHKLLVDYAYLFSRERLSAQFSLSEKEEALQGSLSRSGHQAWGQLYITLSGQIKCDLQYDNRTETVGLSQALAFLKQGSEPRRKAAWHAIQKSWGTHLITATAIINSLADWRHEMNRKRSLHKKVHHLDESLHMNGISRTTLEAMLKACYNNIEDIRKVPRIMATFFGKNKLEPWNTLAPSPVLNAESSRPFSQSISMIENAFNEISPEMGQFVKMMIDQKLIEGRVLPQKITGAYCDDFKKSKRPIIFMSYMGSDNDVCTLAHELGHAFHYWALKDMPYACQGYSMSLAETASIFAETTLRDAMIKNAKSNEEKMQFLWSEAESAMGFLINIPARFEFENSFYEKTLKRTLNPEEICQISDEAWTKWYGQTLTQNDKLFWAHKLHFHIAGVSFYNYPYAFGYLFSLAIYARRKTLGKDFFKTYVNILKDTGRMTAEDLVQKHLGEDIQTVEFWQKSIDVVKEKISLFEILAKEFKPQV